MKKRLTAVGCNFLPLQGNNRSVNREGAWCLGFREVIDSFMWWSEMRAREMWSG